MREQSTRAWLWPFLEPLKSVFSETLAISLFVNFLALAVPVFTLQVYDRVVFHAGISTLKGLVIGMAIVLLFDFVLRQSRTRIMQTVALKVDVLVGRRLFNKVMALPLQTLESQPGAHWQALFRDVDMVRNTLSGASAVLLTDLPFVLLFLGLIYVIATPLFPILMVILPIFMIVAWRSGSVMANANKQERQSSMSRDGMIAEMVAGRTTIKALALDRAMRPIWEKKHAENIENSVHRGSKADSYTNLGTTLTLMTTISLTTFGAWFIINQEMTMGSLIATNMLSGRLLGPLNQLVGQWRTYNSFKQAVERLGQVFLAPSERQVSEISMGRPRGEITLETVTYTYLPDAAPVLDNVQLSIKAGGVHALVGRNGSGKTTLLKILQGLYKPSTGRVMLDGADIAQFTRAELADWIGYVPQESVLFEGSVRDNISHRRPDSDDAEIIRAATAAGVHHFIIDLPDGYATEIGEAGRRLSGGQRQRISVARALVGDPPVLLLDEPSSNLDRQAEHELRDTITELGRLHTVIVVTHSPILLAACNNLVALEKGKIALAGPAQEILPRLFGSRRGAKPQPGAEEEKKTGTPGGDGEPALQSRPWRAVKPRQPSPGEAADQVAPPAPDRADGSVEPNIERDAYIGGTAPSTPAATTVVDATPKDEVPAENSTQKPFSVDQT
jgi:ATP-binding cassette subfamily C protein LapB